MTQTLINTEKKDSSLNPRQIRQKGLVPATIYGKGMESVSIQLDVKEFIAAYKKDKNAIFELKMDKTTYSAIVKKVQIEAISDKVLNIEFQSIKADQKVKITVTVETIGDSPAVKAGGKLIINTSKIEIECLPSNIPSAIKVDISKLVNYEEVITIKQIEFPKDIQPLGNLEDIVVKIAAPKVSKESK